MKNFIYVLLIMIILSCSNKEENTNSSNFDITELSILNSSGTTPKKGDPIILTISLENKGTDVEEVEVIPLLSSNRFSDFQDVKLKGKKVMLAAGEKTSITINAGPFIHDKSTDKHYALGSGEYVISSILINEKVDKDFSGKTFSITSSNSILVPVLFDPVYLTKIGYAGGIEAYLEKAFTRKVELYENETYTTFLGGLDEMMDINHIFYVIETKNVEQVDEEGGKCEKALALAKEELGLANNWNGPVGTQKANHGFDYLMALSRDSFGGVACGWLNVQVTGVFDFDLSLERSQILVIHETSHLLGSPHCDPLQSYVMCAGEKHQKYIDEGTYVYNIVSRNQMSNKFD
tara:strand:+ start:93410 stop:94453 length:1044 start_codon:yes stop_codon:yes gene_type:complete